MRLILFLLQKYKNHIISENNFSEKLFFFNEQLLINAKDGITSCVIPSLKYNNVMVMKSHTQASRHDCRSRDGCMTRQNP